MGTWGQGPFDSDDGADFLDDLIDDHAARDACGDLDASRVDHPAVAQAVAAQLEATTEQTEYSDCGAGYAAVGLVALALSAPTASTSSQETAEAQGEPTPEPEVGADDEADGRNLLLRRDLAALLDARDAALLRDAASAALARLARNGPWMRAWRSPVGGVLDELAAVLRTAPEPTAAD